MDLKMLATVFITVFLAELGDKTQLATILFAADHEASKLAVFAGAALALILATAIGVLAGDFVARHVNMVWLRYLAGASFIVIGLWTLIRTWAAGNRYCR